MKNFYVLLIVLFCLEASAQVDTIPLPTGYTSAQLNSKSILRVSPDDHVWVGFNQIGVGEYDGTSWRMYTDTNGLPSRRVNALAFNGSIKWIGTNNGLVKTDGVNILSFNTGNSPLPSNKINYLFQSDTALWIATDSGAVSFDGFYWNIYNTSNSPITSDKILCINETSFGIYISDINSVNVLTSTGWRNTTPAVSPVHRFTKDKAGFLYTFNYQIRDSVFNEKIYPSDPCLYNSLTIQPYYFLGSVINNVSYASSEPFSQTINYIFEFDSLLNITNTYSIPADVGHCLSADTFNLFDFNSLGEIISTDNLKPIYITNFTGLNALPVSDSCPFLDVNEVRARIWNNGSQFWDLEGNSLYEVPKESRKSPIFSEGLWIGGKDAQNKLHIAAQTYRQSGNDFWPGPLDTTNATIDPGTLQQYDKLWKIDRYTINDFLLNFQNGNVANGSYTIPDIILNWPVAGTGNYSRILAPFIDNNSDGVYNPIDGDYPDVKGDQAFWWVFNDNNSIHGETHSQFNLGVEIHGNAYAYTCPLLTNNDSVLNYTTFYHYDFINRSDTDYHDVYIGVYTDIDLGNYLDDYVGCDTTLDIAYALNGDDDDEGQHGYGQHPPMINLALLKGPEATINDALDNNHNGIVDEAGENCMMNYLIYSNNDFTATGNPVTTQDHYNRLQGIWKDSLPLTYGGDGHDPLSTDYTHYMFSGSPYDSTGWSEFHPCTGCASNSPGDRRITTSSGPFDLPAHGIRSIDYAYVYTRQPNFPNGANTSLAVNHDQVMRIKHFFETDSLPCKHLIGIDEIKKDNLALNLYPNPAHSEITVTFVKPEQGVKTYFITDITGKEIISPVKISSSSFSINLSKVNSGLYFLHVLTNNKSCVKKFVVE